MQDNEIWKSIPNYEGLYEVSSFGRVRTVKTGRLKKQPVHWKGYPVVTLRKPVQQCNTFRTHRLVAIAFIRNEMNYPQVNHKDGNKQNNHVSNLEWCNNSMNQIHSINNKLRVMPSGLYANKAIITLHTEYGIFCTISDAARECEMDDTTFARNIRKKGTLNKYTLV